MPVTQIAVVAARHEHVLASAFLQRLDDMGAEKARAAGHNHALVGPEVHGDCFTQRSRSSQRGVDDSFEALFQERDVEVEK